MGTGTPCDGVVEMAKRTEMAPEQEVHTMGARGMGARGEPMQAMVTQSGTVRDTATHGARAKEAATLTTKVPDLATLGETALGTEMPCGKGRVTVTPLARVEAPGAPSGRELATAIRFVRDRGRVLRSVVAEEMEMQDGKVAAGETPFALVTVPVVRDAKGQVTVVPGEWAKVKGTLSEMVAALVTLAGQDQVKAVPSAQAPGTETLLPTAITMLQDLVPVSARLFPRMTGMTAAN